MVRVMSQVGLTHQKMGRVKGQPIFVSKSSGWVFFESSWLANSNMFCHI